MLKVGGYWASGKASGQLLALTLYPHRQQGRWGLRALKLQLPQQKPRIQAPSLEPEPGTFKSKALEPQTASREP